MTRKMNPAELAAHQRRQRLQMIEEFERMASELRAAVAEEEERTGEKDPEHFRYPIFCKAARNRLTKLEASITELRAAA